ncbi:hypothetical protein P7K49_004456 [Saguinus oedipus]|uniref:UBC core domain-containing protein n=1 Tax=Saguinus oedipus TaxID=9490 RepID=A0ABQ9W815_SAGOE|nr:hypothetical protein P7K49_004456 [Saguinus oedipus]
MKELQDIARLSDRFISVELVDESLFDWNVKLHQVDKDSVLWQDMKETNTEFILLNLTFPDNFPFSPPFMRVLSPRLENGYVLDGGAICMELLTPRGWSSAYTVEAVMRQFAASLVKGQGQTARMSLLTIASDGSFTQRNSKVLESRLEVMCFGKAIKIPGQVFKENWDSYQTDNYFERESHYIPVMFRYLSGFLLQDSVNLDKVAPALGDPGHEECQSALASTPGLECGTMV